MNIIDDIRKIAQNKKSAIRKSSFKEWEYNGLSYIMTVSVIQQSNKKYFDYKNFDEDEKKNLEILLEPGIAHKDDSMI